MFRVFSPSKGSLKRGERGCWMERRKGKPGGGGGVVEVMVVVMVGAMMRMRGIGERGGWVSE